MTPVERGAGPIPILGLDPSLTSFGVARVNLMSELLWAGQTEVWKTGSRGAARLSWFYDKITDELEEQRPGLVVIEGYAYARGNQQAQMGELGGVIRLALQESGVTWMVIPPTSLKKFVTGKGNSPKDRVMMEAWKRFEIDVPTTDETEATCLALMGATGCYDYLPNVPKVNLAALTKLEFPRHGPENFWVT